MPGTPPIPAIAPPPRLDHIDVIADARGSKSPPAIGPSPPMLDIAIIGFIIPIPMPPIMTLR